MMMQSVAADLPVQGILIRGILYCTDCNSMFYNNVKNKRPEGKNDNTACIKTDYTTKIEILNFELIEYT